MKNVAGDWRLISQTNVQDGYRETVCFKCTTSEASVSADNYVFWQEPMAEDNLLTIVIIVAGVFLAVIILVLGFFYKSYLEKLENIKYRRK